MQIFLSEFFFERKYFWVVIFLSANFLECKELASKTETGFESTTTHGIGIGIGQLATPFQVLLIFSREIFL